MDKWGHNLLNQVAMQQAGYEHANVQGGSGEGERKREKKRFHVNCVGVGGEGHCGA